MTLDGLNEDFRDLLVQLADAGAEFLIVGAYALGFHGAPRASGDIDVFLRASADNASRVFEALVRFGAPVAAAGVTPADFGRSEMVYQIGLPPRRIDLLTSISGVSFEDAWRDRVAAEVEGRTVHFIGKSDLIKNKLAAGRPKDLADASRLTRRRPRD